jgi:hypothetical protein
MEICPICKQVSLIKVPEGKNMKEFLNSYKHVSNEYSLKCLNVSCNFSPVRTIEKIK